LARQSRVSSDTLRHYERLGLLPLPERTAGNYREYSPAAPKRVELIQRALTIGFSLAELKTILTVRDKGGAPAATPATCCVRKSIISTSKSGI
jgi:DNA-binding transcriptional MerR regulator